MNYLGKSKKVTLGMAWLCVASFSRFKPIHFPNCKKLVVALFMRNACESSTERFLPAKFPCLSDILQFLALQFKIVQGGPDPISPEVNTF